VISPDWPRRKQNAHLNGQQALLSVEVGTTSVPLWTATIASIATRACVPDLRLRRLDFSKYKFLCFAFLPVSHFIPALWGLCQKILFHSELSVRLTYGLLFFFFSGF